MTEQLKLSDLVRRLRQQLGLSQEKFAAQLGVSFRTVSRWENGHAVPSQMALKLIEAMVKALSDSPLARPQTDRSRDPLNHYFSEEEERV